MRKDGFSMQATSSIIMNNAVINGITRNANLTDNQSPCLDLPAEAWDEPQLLSACPLCRQPLKFNPFVVDNRGRSA